MPQSAFEMLFSVMVFLTHDLIFLLRLFDVVSEQPERVYINTRSVVALLPNIIRIGCHYIF